MSARIDLFLIVTAATRTSGDLVFPGINVRIRTNRTVPDKPWIQG